MMKLLLKWLAVSFGVWLCAQFLPGVWVDSFSTTLWVAFALGLVNLLVKPFLTLFSIPLIILTLGLFLWVINALMLLLVEALVDGFHLDSFFWALIASACISLVSTIAYAILKEEEGK